MGKGKTGTATSSLVNAKNVSAITSDCKNCFHSVNKNNILYCKYYDLFSPKKKKCARFSFLDKRKDQKKAPVKKLQQAKKEPTFPWERS